MSTTGQQVETRLFSVNFGKLMRQYWVQDFIIFENYNEYCMHKFPFHVYSLLYHPWHFHISCVTFSVGIFNYSSPLVNEMKAFINLHITAVFYFASKHVLHKSLCQWSKTNVLWILLYIKHQEATVSFLKVKMMLLLFSYCRYC